MSSGKNVIYLLHVFKDKEMHYAIAELSKTSLFCEIITRITENTWNFGPEEDDGPVIFCWVQVVQLHQVNAASWAFLSEFKALNSGKTQEEFKALPQSKAIVR